MLIAYDPAKVHFLVDGVRQHGRGADSKVSITKEKGKMVITAKYQMSSSCIYPIVIKENSDELVSVAVLYDGANHPAAQLHQNLGAYLGDSFTARISSCLDIGSEFPFITFTFTEV